MAAPKGNKKTVLDEGKPKLIGRPPKFAKVSDFEEAAQVYFDQTPFNQWTVTGLALALGTTRETLDDYLVKPEFSDSIKRAKQMVQHSYECSLRENGRAGDIFGLKNFGWKDKTEVDLNDITERTEDQLRKRLEQLLDK